MRRTIRSGVDDVDWIDALVVLALAEVYGVDAEMAGPAVGTRLAADPGGYNQLCATEVVFATVGAREVAARAAKEVDR